MMHSSYLTGSNTTPEQMKMFLTPRVLVEGSSHWNVQIDLVGSFQGLRMSGCACRSRRLQFVHLTTRMLSGMSLCKDSPGIRRFDAERARKESLDVDLSMRL